jgi:hypothetical protein
MFDGVSLEDTWVLGWRHENDQLVVNVEASLWPGHPAYGLPQPGEWTCYKRGRLVFEAVRSVDGLPDRESGVPPYVDANGERDFGSIDPLQMVEGGYRLRFDFGDVQIQCGAMRLDLGDA